MQKVAWCLSFLALSLSALNASAQNAASYRTISPDPGKIVARTYSTPMKPVPCGGSANTQSADLNWQPILAPKIVEVEHDGPQQDLIDSIQAAKLVLKRKYELNNPGIGSGEKTTTVPPTVGHNFRGNSNTGASPLDNTIAISNGKYIVSVINSAIQYYDTLGTNLYSNSFAIFLPPAFNVTGACDPVVIYDPGSDRFIFFCQQYPLVAGGKIYVCFSKTNNPLNGWWTYQLFGDPTPGNNDAFDYPKLAVSDSELFITGNLFQPNGPYDQSVVFQLNKLAGYAGDSLTGTNWTGITGSPFTLLPVSWGQSGSVSGSMFLVSTHNFGGSDIGLYQIVGNASSNPVMNNWSIPTTSYSVPANAGQSGTTCLLNINDCRALSGFILDSTIHFVFNSDAGTGYCGINYNRLDLNSLTNNSNIFGMTGFDCSYGAISSFATSTTDKSVMIGFGRSGSSIFPEIRAVNCDNIMNWSTSTLVHASTSYVGNNSTSVERWGDYTGMSRQHNSPIPSVWISGMIGGTAHTWSTWIAQISAPLGNGVSELANQQTAKVYPNPVSQKDFHVEFSLTENTDLTISVIDMNGRMVKELYSGKGSVGDNIFSFNKANLPNGTYILNIRSATQNIRNEKIIIAD